jgi:hypothetical protein
MVGTAGLSCPHAEERNADGPLGPAAPTGGEFFGRDGWPQPSARFNQKGSGPLASGPYQRKLLVKSKIFWELVLIRG